MSKYESGKDLAQKINWEGGVTEFIHSYGTRKEDLPDDLPIDVRIDFEILLEPAYEFSLRRVEDWLEEELEEAE